MKKSSAKANKRMLRFCMVGAAILGILGFLSGVALCLHFRLPIPPLFLTEMGVLLGGSLGALVSMVDFTGWSTPPERESDCWKTYRP